MQIAGSSHAHPVMFPYQLLRSPLETVALTRKGLSGEVIR